MKRLRSPSDRVCREGQTVVLVIVFLLVGLAIVGLLADSANLYRARRLMQNAADAAALAGARLLTGSDKTNGEVLEAIRKYARENGASSGQLEAYYGNSDGELGSISDYDSSAYPPPEATGVRVVVRKTVTVLFAYFLGQSHKIAAAEATAVAGPAAVVKAGGNVFPVAIEDEVLKNVHPGDVVEIWDQAKVTDGGGNPLGGNRGWLNLDFIYSKGDPDGRTTSKNHSDAKLKRWAQYGKSPPVVLYAGHVGEMDGDFINGDPGVRTSAIQQAGSRIGDRLLIPIYDTAYTKSDMQSQADFPTPGIGWASNDYYHIVGFAEFVISGVSTRGSSKYIAGSFLTGAVVPGAYGSGTDMFESDETSKVVTLTDRF